MNRKRVNLKDIPDGVSSFHLKEIDESIKYILSKKNELKSLAKDVSNLGKIKYFSRIKIDYNKIDILNINEECYNYDFNIATILICHQPGIESIKILKNISAIKQKKCLIFTITDSLSWGWCGILSDYRFIMPNLSQTIQPIVYGFTLRLFNHYL